MTAIYNWAIAHPYLIGLGVTVAAGILNAYLTEHPSAARGPLKYALIVLDLLSPLHSKGSTSKGLKLPGSTSAVKLGRLVK